MTITKKDVEQVASLPRLELTDEEKVKFTGQLDTIFDYVEKLKELKTDDITPTSHVVVMQNVFREDKVVEFADRDAILRNAPEIEDSAYVVPKIV